MRRTVSLVLATALTALALVADASAGGGNYVFDGGSASARAQVRAALDASSFPWDLVPVEVTIHIEPGRAPAASPGEIWLDRRLLASGQFAWGIVQHEYAHQVAFFSLGRRARAFVTRVLGARGWCYERPGLDHDDHACERFASMLARAYSRVPTSTGHVPAPSRMRPARFRSVVAAVVGAPVAAANARVGGSP